MKLLFVGTPAGGGGAETHLVELATAVADVRHDVSAFVRPGDVIERGLAAHGGVQLFAGRFERASDPAPTLALLRVARRVRPDWIIGSFRHEYYSVALAGRMSGARVAFFQHTALPARRMTTYAIPRICDRLFVPSRFLREHLVERGMPPERISVSYNPIDTVRLHPDVAWRARTRAALRFAPEDIVVGFVGRIEPAKGPDVLALAAAHAMNADPRIRILWVGAGTWSAGLHQHIETSGHKDRHVLTGWVPDAHPYYVAMDVLALPSTYSETFGRVSVEAQACGVPVIASDLAGIPETLVVGGTGQLVPPGDVHAWTNALLRMTDDATRCALAKAGPAFVAENFSAQTVARDFLAMLESA